MNLSFSPPSRYGVNHPDWKPSQFEALQFILNHILTTRTLPDEEKVKFIFLELPPGLGKSAIATALGHDNTVTALMHTLPLLDQYEKYKWKIVKGKQEYPCPLESKINAWSSNHNIHRIPLASDCHLNSMKECNVYSQCFYAIDRKLAINSTRSACTYRYMALSKAMQSRSGILVLDEGHAAPREWLNFAKWEVSENTRLKYKLSQFPYKMGYGENNKGGILDDDAREILIEWFEESIRNTKVYQVKNNHDLRRKQFSENMKRILTTLADDTPYFFESGSRVGQKLNRSVYTPSPGMRLRALSAVEIANKVWSNKEFVVFMSATMTPKPIADQLGIKKYVFESFPHPVPVDKRPVYDLSVQRMTHINLTKSPNLYAMQAIEIRKLIDILPSDWRGAILTSSFKKIKQLKRRMVKWYPGRIFDPERTIKGSNRVNAYKLDRTPGLIAIETVQGWGEGIDLVEERFIIIAGVHFKDPYDPFTIARKKMPGGSSFYLSEAYNLVSQATGRTVRGVLEENGDYQVNLIAIADGSALSASAKKHYSEWMNGAVREFDRDEIVELLRHE